MCDFAMPLPKLHQSVRIEIQTGTKNDSTKSEFPRLCIFMVCKKINYTLTSLHIIMLLVSIGS